MTPHEPIALDSRQLRTLLREGETPKVEFKRQLPSPRLVDVIRGDSNMSGQERRAFVDEILKPLIGLIVGDEKTCLQVGRLFYGVAERGARDGADTRSAKHYAIGLPELEQADDEFARGASAALAGLLTSEIRDKLTPAPSSKPRAEVFAEVISFRDQRLLALSVPPLGYVPEIARDQAVGRNHQHRGPCHLGRQFIDDRTDVRTVKLTGDEVRRIERVYSNSYGRGRTSIAAFLMLCLTLIASLAAGLILTQQPLEDTARAERYLSEFSFATNPIIRVVEGYSTPLTPETERTLGELESSLLAHFRIQGARADSDNLRLRLAIATAAVLRGDIKTAATYVSDRDLGMVHASSPVEIPYRERLLNVLAYISLNTGDFERSYDFCYELASLSTNPRFEARLAQLEFIMGHSNNAMKRLERLQLQLHANDHQLSDSDQELLAIVYGYTASILLQQQRLAAALNAAACSIGIYNTLQQSAAVQYAIAVMDARRGHILYDLQRYQSAGAAYTNAIVALAELDVRLESPLVLHMLSIAYNNRSNCHRRSGQPDAQQRDITNAIACACELLSTDSPELALDALALVIANKGRADPDPDFGHRMSLASTELAKYLVGTHSITSERLAENIRLVCNPTDTATSFSMDAASRMRVFGQQAARRIGMYAELLAAQGRVVDAIDSLHEQIDMYDRVGGALSDHDMRLPVAKARTQIGAFVIKGQGSTSRDLARARTQASLAIVSFEELVGQGREEACDGLANALTNRLLLNEGELLNAVSDAVRAIQFRSRFSAWQASLREEIYQCDPPAFPGERR